MHNICFLKIKPWLEHDLEICTSIRPLGDELMFYNIKKGEYSPYFDELSNKVKSKRVCTQTIQPIVLHTHPYKSYSYPSIEDISQILQLNIKGSFIICNWGIWYLQKNDQNQVFTLDEKLKDKLYDMLDDLGIDTHNTSYSEKNDKHKSIFYCNRVEKCIKRFMRRYEKLNIPMKIYFVDWLTHEKNKICLDVDFCWFEKF
jgi:hypothetical protein